MDSEPLQLILVSGTPFSGKSSFLALCKNSFLQSLPERDLRGGMEKGSSFYAVADFSLPSDSLLLREAKKQGYRITVYFLFAGKLVSLWRARLRLLAEGVTFDERDFRRRYDASFRGLVKIYPFVDLVFLVSNQKSLKFLSAYETASNDIGAFAKGLSEIRKSVDILL